jgi:hypothetical protein
MVLSKARLRWWLAPTVAVIAGLLISGCGSGDANETPNDDGSAGQQVVPTNTALPDDGSSDESGEQPATDPTPTSESSSGSTEATEAEQAEPEQSEPAGLAPALGSIDSWHNSEPLTLDQLRGSPVLLVFWADF